MLISGFDAVLTDLDGVVYAGAGAIEGAVESLDRLAGLGVSLAYVTNNASRSPEVVAGHLRALGVPARSDQVFDSASAGADLLAKLVEIGSVVLVVGSAYLRECVTARGMVLALSEHERIDAVIQGFDPTLGWKDLAAAAFAINKGALWVATNTDLTIPRAEGIARATVRWLPQSPMPRASTPMWRASRSRCCSNAPLSVLNRLTPWSSGTGSTRTSSVVTRPASRQQWCSPG